MHGLVNRAVEQFVRDTYGRDTWHVVVQRAELGITAFEPMLEYDPSLTNRMIDRIVETLSKPVPEVLEDIGTYLVSPLGPAPVRRLLRFGGRTFREFLYSLDDLPDRAGLALPGLELPRLELREHADEFYTVGVDSARFAPLRIGPVLMGLLRSLADDYGALVMLSCKNTGTGQELLEIRLLDPRFATAREFSLGGV